LIHTSLGSSFLLCYFGINEEPKEKRAVNVNEIVFLF